MKNKCKNWEESKKNTSICNGAKWPKHSHFSDISLQEKKWEWYQHKVYDIGCTWVVLRGWYPKIYRRIWSWYIGMIVYRWPHPCYCITNKNEIIDASTELGENYGSIYDTASPPTHGYLAKITIRDGKLQIWPPFSFSFFQFATLITTLIVWEMKGGVHELINCSFLALHNQDTTMVCHIGNDDQTDDPKLWDTKGDDRYFVLKFNYQLREKLHYIYTRCLQSIHFAWMQMVRTNNLTQ